MTTRVARTEVTAGLIATALTRPAPRPAPAPARSCGRSGARAADTIDRRVERGRVEVRPQQVGEIELGVGELPEQEIADALLAAGADEEIGLGRVRHRKVRLERFGHERPARRERLGMRGEIAARGLRDVPAAAVVGGDGEREPRVAAPSAPRRRRRARECARSKRDVSPTTLKRMPFECSFATSRSSARTNSSIRIDTSSAGRRQFSLENANSVRYSTPRSIAARTVARTASTPLRWPATRGSSRLLRPAAVAVHDDRDVPRDGARLGNVARRAR